MIAWDTRTSPTKLYTGVQVIPSPRSRLRRYNVFRNIVDSPSMQASLQFWNGVFRQTRNWIFGAPVSRDYMFTNSESVLMTLLRLGLCAPERPRRLLPFIHSRATICQVQIVRFIISTEHHAEKISKLARHLSFYSGS